MEIISEVAEINQAILDLINESGPIGGENGGNEDETISNSNEDVFGMELHYFDGNGELSALPQFNGNISWIEWSIKSDQRHAYGFQYDGVNRLSQATYGEDKISTPECKIEQTDKYSVPKITYDPLGNIKNLYRKGLKDPSANIPEYGNIDGLIYNYAGNSSLLLGVSDESSQLRGFKGSSSNYGYDNTGNLISDSQKGISNILYSYNDLPLKIISEKGNVFNWYTSDGIKVKSKVVYSASPYSEPPVTTNYINSAEYKDNILEAIYVDEGRVVFPKNENAYVEYLLKDHLGNMRARIADKNGDNLVNIDSNNPDKDELMDIRHYYPFGMEWDTPLEDSGGNSLEASGVKNKYTYNGKEFVDDLDINLHDYGARYYDPAIGRFTSVDPISDDFPHLSTFNYASNNPITNIDLWGLQGVDFNTGEVDNMQSYFKQNASKSGKRDDCMTCHIKGVEKLTNNTIPKGDNSDGKNSIVRQRSAMQNEGLANETQTIGFKDAKGNNALAVGQADAMDGSVAKTAETLSAGTENSVFGVSLADGYHTMTLTVTTEALDGPTPDGSPLTATTFTLSDQGTTSGTLRKGNLSFNSPKALDQHLTDYVKNIPPKNFPANVEIHQIVNPNR